MDKIDLAKNVLRFAVSAGVTKIVAGAISNNVQPKNVYDTVVIFAASVAITGVVKKTTDEYVNNAVDKVANWWQTNITEKKTA